MANLYIVATPIGNLQDISLRAIEILDSVDFILCEDTRKTTILLRSIVKKFPAFKNKAKLVSYYEENEPKRIPEVIELLKKDFNFALVSDAGTPTISDPGFKLVREAVKEKINVQAIPGPSSVITALVSSGLPTDKFMFVGFLPKKPGHRTDLLKNIKTASKTVKQTIIFFESPFRIVKVLEELQTVFGDIDIVTTRELTKIYEEIRREKISEALLHFNKNKPRGEFVILFHL
jgi:16S rRNA (cytidine1402-2'-O)-methyltransferase